MLSRLGDSITGDKKGTTLAPAGVDTGSWDSVEGRVTTAAGLDKKRAAGVVKESSGWEDWVITTGSVVVEGVLTTGNSGADGAGEAVERDRSALVASREASSWSISTVKSR